MSATETISADFPFESKYVKVLGSKLHYVAEGQGEPILFLHGNPTSSYLWRNIIPYLTSLGRCIAPDLIGMGKSDKPDLDYHFFDHLRYLEGFIENLNLKKLLVVAHGWGAVLGFHYARQHEANVKGLVFMETLVGPLPDWDSFPQPSRELLQALRMPGVGWELIVKENIFIEKALPGGIVRQISEGEMEQYRAPFKKPASRKPVWRWPNESPIAGEPADVAEVVTLNNEWLQHSRLPKLLFYATPGQLISAPHLDWCSHNLTNLKVVHLGEGLHFVQ
jgi:haloalkane dehalogenase